jgi:hypothetical protein
VISARAAIGAVGLALVLGGCTSASLPAASTPAVHHSPPVTTPPAPAPVATSATLNQVCTVGYEWSPNATGATGVFIPGPAPAGDATDPDATTPEDPALAYQVTLTNSSGATADVGGYAVAFYDSTGAEDGSDQESATGFITPGQALNFTVIEDQTVHGYGDDPRGLAQTSAIPAGAATCQVVQWLTGPPG